MNIVLYHAKCSDGFGAAYAAWKKFGDDAKYIPVNHKEPLPEIENGSNVFILDFSYPKEILEDLAKRCTVVVLDHHKTAEADLKDLDFCIFDMNRSGAMMAWNFFHPGEEVPLLISYIQDRDLWKHELPNSKEVNTALQSKSFDFKLWDNLSIPKLTEEGSYIINYSNSLINNICQNAHWVEKFGYKFIAVNASSHWSEIGNKLCELYPDSPFAASYYMDKDKNIKWSLRSTDNGIDVSVLAKKHGGGGHRNSAGLVEKFN